MTAALDLVLQELAAAKRKHPTFARCDDETVTVMASEFGEYSSALLLGDINARTGPSARRPSLQPCASAPSSTGPAGRLRKTAPAATAGMSLKASSASAGMIARVVAAIAWTGRRRRRKAVDSAKKIPCLNCGLKSVDILSLHGGKGTGETTVYAAECSACGHAVPGLPSNGDGRIASAAREYLRMVQAQPAPAPLPEEDFMEILNDALKHAVWVPGEELRASATMLRQFADLHKKWPLAEAIRRVLRAITSQARRLAEVEATLRGHDAMTTKLVSFERAKAENGAYLSWRAAELTVQATERLEAAEARVREMETKLGDAESDASCERIKRKCAEGRTQEMKKAIARYLAEQKQPGSDRRAEFEALASLHALAAMEATA